MKRSTFDFAISQKIYVLHSNMICPGVLVSYMNAIAHEEFRMIISCCNDRILLLCASNVV